MAVLGQAMTDAFRGSVAYRPIVDFTEKYASIWMLDTKTQDS
jgi:hypothetical protein